MSAQRILISSAIIISVLAVVVVLTLALTPQETPPFDAAVKFMMAAGQGDDETAFALLSDTMQAYVTDHCPDGSVSACVRDYTPPEWGDFVSVIYRRARPHGSAWDVLLIASYAEGEGFSGVCIRHRMEQNAASGWQVAAWSGFIACDEPNAGLQELADDLAAPNRAP
ncbi:MAG: hypothetical protein K8I60_20170 [Anaerolineae bacterium]|nr:hypothetical protein [Anaerolineae bacterium]